VVFLFPKFSSSYSERVPGIFPSLKFYPSPR
jgi:hypothetical protein